ncbi:aldehyde dehydrogenase family protein [Streptomyces mutabilis]|uniref:aldehyde dehydrogenase family protein n=1 Tax=Streptomyces mutabilis TaxID=67332 RepID=UPI0039862F79
MLRRSHHLVIDRQDEVLDLIQLENSKARRHAFEEIMDVALNARYCANTAQEYLRPKRRQGAQPGLTRVCELHHPKGLVGVISPWNYPLTLGISDALPAIVAGNAILTKPDAQTPFSALWAVDLLEEAGMQPGLVQVVTGAGAELSLPIIENCDFLMFTGSTAVGRTVAALVSQKQLDPVIRHVEDAKSKGATVLAWGMRRPVLGPFFCEPTIPTGVDGTMEVYAHETFGPLVSIHRVADEEKAIAKANDSEYGLNFSVWTGDARRGRRVRGTPAGRNRQRQRRLRRSVGFGRRHVEVQRVPDHRRRARGSGRSVRRSRPRALSQRRFGGPEDPQAPSWPQVDKKE